MRQNILRIAVALAVVASVVALPLAADDGTEFRQLRHLQTVTRDDLNAVCSTNLSSDGKYLYAAAWQAAAILTFERDPQSGLLTHRQSIIDETDLRGTTTIRLSPDGRYAVAPALHARAVVLFERDVLSGKLTILDVVRGEEQPRLGLAFPVDAVFSPDGRFVYVCDPSQSGAANERNRQGSVLVFKVSRPGKLDLVEVNRGRDDAFYGCRAITFHPSGRTAFAACTNSSQVVVADRHAETGKLTVKQILRDSGATALEGVIGILCG